MSPVWGSENSLTQSLVVMSHNQAAEMALREQGTPANNLWKYQFPLYSHTIQKRRKRSQDPRRLERQMWQELNFKFIE